MPSPPSSSFAGLVKLTEVVKLLQDGQEVCAVCPNHVTPPPEFVDQLLGCNANEELRLTDAHGDLKTTPTIYLLAAKAIEVERNDGDVLDKWVSSDSVCVWIVDHDHKPDPSWQQPERFLDLKEKDTVVMTERKDGAWAGWAQGFVWTEGSQGRSHRRGVFPVSFATPHIWLAKPIATCHDV